MSYAKPLRRSWAEPWKVKMVELLKMTTPEQRQRAIEEAGYNTFLLPSEAVYIDLLTDSGTNAMSDVQWSGLMQGDEAYAGSKNFYHLWEAVSKYYGYQYLVPTHQGRGAEHILSQIAIKAGDFVPGNMYFTTTRLHQELAGGTFVDVIIDEAHDPASEHPFKGNVDVAKLERLISEVGAKKIPYVSVAGTVNMAGGQPQSLANMRELRDLCRARSIRIVLDATRHGLHVAPGEAAVSVQPLKDHHKVARFFKKPLVVGGEPSSNIHQRVFLRAHSAGIGVRAVLLKDVCDLPVLITGFSLLNKVGILNGARCVEDNSYVSGAA